MVDVSYVQGNNNNGTATPATTGSITATAGNLLIVAITITGSSLTIATPTGGGTWTLIQDVSGSAIRSAVFMQANCTGGATNPSSVLGGTITGWVAEIFEFNNTGANCALQGSVQRSATNTEVTNIFSNQVGVTIPCLLFFYTIGRPTAVFSSSLSGLNPPNGGTSWSSSVQPLAGVQGISQDSYWGTNLAQGGFAPYPVAQGSLASSVTYKAVAAWFNVAIAHTLVGVQIGGSSGQVQPPFYQGMVGG